MKKCHDQHQLLQQHEGDVNDPKTTTTTTTCRTDSGYVSSGLVTDASAAVTSFIGANEDNDSKEVSLHRLDDDDVRTDSGLSVTTTTSTTTSGCFSSLSSSLSLSSSSMDDVQIERFAMLNMACEEDSSSRNIDSTCTLRCSTTTGSEDASSDLRHERLCLYDEAFLPDKDGDTYLHLAIVHGRWDIISRLVQLAPHSSFLDFQNNLLQSPLHLAVLMDLPKTVRCLVLSGATLDVRNRVGNTPLHVACELGRIECARELLRPISCDEWTSYDGTPPRPIKQDLEIRNYEGQMCVHIAALGHHLEVLGLLRSYGANMNAREGKSGRTALCLAIESRRWPLVSYLIGECRASVDEPTYAGLTPFQLAHAADPRLAAAILRLGVRPTQPVLSDTDDTSSDDDSDYGSIAGENMDTDAVGAVDHLNYSDLKINGQPLW